MALRPNLPALFLGSVRERSRPDFLATRRPEGWQWISSQQALTAVHEIAGGLIALGVNAGDRVALISENRPEWLLCDLGIQFAAAITVPVYPTLPRDQVRYLLIDSGSRLVIASSAEQAAKVAAVRKEASSISHLVSMDAQGDGLTPLEHVRELGRRLLTASPGVVEERLAGLAPGNLATIIYTSGTTGTPKGVMLTHGNICHNVHAAIQMFNFARGETAISFLPLSHVLERMALYAYIEFGLAIAFVRSLERLADSLLEVRPHVFVTVPRLLERVAERVRGQIDELPVAKRLVARRALAWADGAVRDFLANRAPRGLRALRWNMARHIVLDKLREKMGGRIRFMISGGAALAPDVARFFWAAGIPVFEGYGMTETAPVLTANSPGRVKLGTVGHAITGVELRIARDGEVLARGPNVMRGYWNLDDDTDDALRGGWMHTGDLGEIDEEGFLRLTGRKKDILVLSTGKNIAPRAIEEALERSSYINRAIAVGDERPSVGVLIVPNFEALATWARARGLRDEDRAALLVLPEVRQLFQSEMIRLQSSLAVFEKARQFEFLHEEPSEENGLLTPTQKVRRAVVLQRFGDLVERMYR
ncbi:MAG: long-chain fatty acid--CoA ligase [Acidobacteria bacterium]|nr:long-chain fatty acid--CoA ligase [Acidobacteriota bacterium]